MATVGMTPDEDQDWQDWHLDEEDDGWDDPTWRPAPPAPAPELSPEQQWKDAMRQAVLRYYRANRLVEDIRASKSERIAGLGRRFEDEAQEALAQILQVATEHP